MAQAHQKKNDKDAAIKDSGESRGARPEQRSGEKQLQQLKGDSKGAMKRRVTTLLPAIVLLSARVGAADAKPAAKKPAAAAKKQPLVEFEMMTWPEVKAAIAAGKTTALFYTGGTEQRGPQNVNGGHTLMGTRNRRNHRVAARQRDRDAGAAVHAEQRERRSAGHDWADA